MSAIKIKTIDQKFKYNAFCNPNCIAIKNKNKKITYSELNMRVEEYASALNFYGVKKGYFIGVYLNRSIDMIAMLIAILRCGAAYVPLDITYPMERIEGILIDANCQFVITSTQLLKQINFKNSLVLEELQKMMALPRLAENLTQPEDIAYIIYTSGTTGNPKGVTIQHANTLSLLEWAESIYSEEERKGVLASTSICFDLSVFEIFFPLTFGGTVILVDNILELDNLSENLEITLINTVPSAIREILHLDAIPLTVITINLAGETLHQTLVNDLYKLTHVKHIYNLYAPSETTTYSTYYHAQPNENIDNVPIGKPILGTQIFLLDKWMQPLPYQCKGEIYIEGKGVSKGYLNNLNATKDKFIEYSFAGENLILYKTGDLGRVRHDKIIEFLGRKDQQVKIRGFRIELGEVETQLLKHSNIVDAAVIVNDSEQESKFLQAYFVANQENLDIKSIISFMNKLVPNHLIPTTFHQLENMPLTSNGKIDMLALKKLPTQITQKLNILINHDDESSVILLNIWKELLGNLNFNINSNFFECGGHSLLATQLVSRIRQTFACHFPLSEIFYNFTFDKQLQYIKTQRNTLKNTLPAIQQFKQTENIPLSFGQQRMWILECMLSDKAISNIPCLIKLSGNLNREAFVFALNQILQRHTALRTHYDNHFGNPIQNIKESTNIALIEHDVSTKSQDYINQMIMDESNRRFNFETDILLKVVVFKTASDEFLLLLKLHHLSADAWSLTIITQELSYLYNAFLRKEKIELPKCIDYADFAIWQQKYLTDSFLSDQINYWKTQLNNAPESISLLLDESRPEQNSYAGSFYYFNISQNIVEELKTLANEEGLTLYMVLIAAYYLLLHAYSSQDDICIGTPIANRNQKEIENTVGFFVNTLVLRHHIDGNQSLQEFLQQVKKVVLGAFNNQDLPFERLVNILGANKNDSRQHPLFQIFFALQNALPSKFDLSGLKTEIINFDRKISKFDLTMALEEKEEEITGLVEYSTDLFYEMTIERIVQNYVNILTQLKSKLFDEISTINIINKDTNHKIVYDWNQTESTYPHLNIITLFREIVAKFPSNVALIDNNKTITYLSLEYRSNQVAHYLQNHNIRPGNPIGLLLDRSENLIVTILAILKVGCHYVPLASDLPSDRLEYFIDDASLKFVVTSESYAEKLPAGTITALCIEADDKLISQLPIDPPNLIATENDMAYIDYTSGSTGNPKGILTSHYNIVRLIKNTNYIHLNDQSILLQLSPISFDGATFDIWGALLNGGKLILMPPSTPQLNIIVDLIKQWNINTIFMTTQIFNALADYHINEIIQLKYLLFGGEAVSIDHVNKFQEKNKYCKLIHVYGPTESTTFATYYPIPMSMQFKNNIPIGKPISNTKLYILDTFQRPVPIKAIGEIYLGGDGLAKGYLNNSELTVEKFRLHEFSMGHQERLYRTGDLAYYDENGDVYFIGRADNQIKRNGYRIELEEIESNIRSLPQIKECVVFYDREFDKLIANITMNDLEISDVAFLKRILSKKLPEYMIPDDYIILDSFVITKNGKIDKSCLQSKRKISVISEKAMPENSLEHLIFNVWTEVLKFDDFTLTDNFFDLGGNSLKMVHVLDRLQQELSNFNCSKIPDMVELFTYPTIKALAQFISTNTVIDDEVKNYAEKRNTRLQKSLEKEI